ncbi:cation diffusion facilitator family transporter [Celeribacter litoreus]|uniref:cation diffusion facilitator family transporter n=1 Tax=Celeribacter litoreus TaxID=2876714 RepID=UPI001CCE6BBF|nr:cation diffusion facilitator family transporter [Celeribacter litoreus]MCA0042699.1 cation diffusion facilitator family transporter [Celeribacter litoreus]
MRDTHLNLSAGIASVSVALILVIAKIWAVSLTGSMSIAASLADSVMDLLVASGGLMAIWYASRPPDDDHAFGHTSAEDLAALAQSAFLIVSAGVISVTSVRRLFSPAAPEIASEGVGIGVMVLSIVLTVALVLWQRHVSGKTGSKVVAADSLHYLGDLIPNLGAILALFASTAFGWNQLDSVVALGAAAILVIGAINIGKSAWDALMDRAAPDEIVEMVERMAKTQDGVYAYHDLKTRMAGAKPFINIHIEVNGDQTLREAHAISADLKRRILAEYPIADVIIHKDVAGEAD